MSADTIALLSQRLERLETQGVKTNPSTCNPAPLGLYGFALTTALLQGKPTTLTEPTTSQLACGFGLFFGGLAQFVAGLLEYPRKNTFGCVAFCCFGAFWMSWAIYGVLVAGDVFDPVPQKGDRLMLTLWGILTFLLWLCTFQKTIVTSALFLTLAMLFWFLAGAVGTTDTAHDFGKFAGAWGMMVAAIAFYDGTAALMADVYGFDVLPVGQLKKSKRVQHSSALCSKSGSEEQV